MISVYQIFGWNADPDLYIDRKVNLYHIWMLLIRYSNRNIEMSVKNKQGKLQVSQKVFDLNQILTGEFDAY